MRTKSGAIAASSDFPVLLLSMYWKGLTTLGAAVGGWLGLLTALVLTVLSLSIWHDVLGYPAGIFPYNAPAMFSMPLAFIACYVVSIMDRSAQSGIEAEKFEAQYIRSKPGSGRRARPRIDGPGPRRIRGRRDQASAPFL